MKKRILIIALFLASIIALVIPLCVVQADSVNLYAVVGQGYITLSGGGTMSSSARQVVGADTITVTHAGTFTVTMCSGTSAVASGAIVSGTPVSCPQAASTNLTVTSLGTFTLTVTYNSTANGSSQYAWSTSSGGQPDASSHVIPTSSNPVLFNANSFGGTGETFTVDTPAVCASMVWTGATNSPTFAGSNALNVAGSCTFIAGMTNSYTGVLTASGATGTFAGAGLATFGEVDITGAAQTISGSNGFTALKFVDASGTQTVTLTNSTTQTVSGTFTATGYSTSARCIIKNSSSTTHAIISAGTVAVTQATISYITGTGAGSWNLSSGDDVLEALANSCTGITFGLHWVGGSATWDGSTLTDWSSVSGATANAIIVPDSTTNVYCDTNSGVSPTITLGAAVNCDNLNFAGANNPILVLGTNIINIYGDISGISRLNNTYTSGNGFVIRGTCHLASNSCVWNAPFTIINTFTLSLSDDFNSTQTIVVRTNCTLITNNHTVTTLQIYLPTTYSGQILTLGSSIVNVGSWNNSGTTVTLTMSGTINCSGNFAGGGITTYNIVNITGAISIISGNNTFLALNGDPTKMQTFKFTDYSNQTITSANLSGSSDIVHTLIGISTGGWTISCASGTLNENYISLAYSTASGGATFNANGASVDAGNNHNWNFTLTVSSSVATNINMNGSGVTTGQFNGSLTDMGGVNNTTVWFQYGLTGTYGSETSHIPDGTPFTNAATYLTTPTYDSSGQVVHPSIVYFATAWNGYQYWMGITPYPAGNNIYENPSILVSNDGQTWVVPAGLTNPVAPYPGGGAYNNDPDLFYDSASNQLWLYYRSAGSGSDIIYRCTSSDGTTWSTAVVVLTTTPSSCLAPSVQKIGSTYYMWSIDNLVIRSSSDGLTWGAPSDCNISTPGYIIIHVEVQYIPSKNQYWMIYNACPTGPNSNYTSLFFATSSDGINWTTYSNQILAASALGWDSREIYKSAFYYNSSTDMLDIWYSAANSSSVWHIGYTSMTYTQMITDLTIFTTAKPGTFSINIPNNLSAGTWYFRAASTNGDTTVYGAQESFTTVLPSPVSSVDTVSSAVYTVGATTIIDVAYGTPKGIFESHLSKDDSNETWDDSGLHDPVVTGDTLVVTAQDGVTKNTYTVTVLPHGPAVSIAISPLTATVASGASQNFYTTGTDAWGNTFSVTGSTAFSIDKGAGGSWLLHPYTYTSEVPGTWTVTGTYGSLTPATATLTVTHGPAVSIAISPLTYNIASGSKTFSATGTDAWGNTFSLTSITNFSIEAGAGGSWSLHPYTYTSEVPGIWTVTGTYGKLTSTATLTVLHGAAVSIAVSPLTTTITSGSNKTFYTTGTDAWGNTFSVTGSTAFSIDKGAGGSWTAHPYTYTSEVPGIWTVTGTYGSLTPVTATLTVK